MPYFFTLFYNLTCNEILVSSFNFFRLLTSSAYCLCWAIFSRLARNAFQYVGYCFLLASQFFLLLHHKKWLRKGNYEECCTCKTVCGKYVYHVLFATIYFSVEWVQFVSFYYYIFHIYYVYCAHTHPPEFATHSSLCVLTYFIRLFCKPCFIFS